MLVIIPAAILLVFIGILGCIVPVIPGPPIALLGMLMIYFTGDGEISTPAIIVYSVVTILTVILDYLIPALGVKYFGGTKYGKWGSFIGTILGLFILPWGIIVGPFSGAIVGELLGNASGGEAMKSGLGSLIGFLLGVLMKFVVCFYFLVIAFIALWHFIAQSYQ